MPLEKIFANLMIIFYNCSSEIQIRSVGASGKLPPVIWKISAHWFYRNFRRATNDFPYRKQAL